MTLPWPPIPLLSPGSIGAGLLEQVPSSRRPGQAMASASSMGPTTKQSQGCRICSPTECVCLYSNIQISLLPQLLHPGVRDLSSGLLIPSAPVQEARTAFPIIGGETEGPVQ